MTGNLAIDTHAPTYLSVHDIHSYYEESYIVQGVSFNVHEGEILALLGRNGAGKTSTLRSIARLDSPQVQRGEIWLDHQALHKMTIIGPQPRVYPWYGRPGASFLVSH